MEDKIKIAFFDLHHKIGLAWEENDGTRRSIWLKVPEEYVEILQDVAHGRR